MGVATHEGVFLSFWEKVNHPEHGLCNVPAVLQHIGEEDGAGCEDVTGTPSGELYNPAPNSVVVRVFGSKTLLDAIALRSDHFCFWMEAIPALELP